MTGYVVGGMLTTSMLDDGGKNYFATAVDDGDYIYCFMPATLITVLCMPLCTLDVVVAVNSAFVGDAMKFLLVVATVFYNGVANLFVYYVDNIG